MDDLGNIKPNNQPKPIKLDDDPDAPIPFDLEDSSPGQVSHAPLDLGGGAAPAPRPPKAPQPKPVARKPAPVKAVTTDRITGVKTFFTKLHPGALEFLDEQIIAWLAENPDIEIKKTNIATGEVQAKKTEANLIITIWF